MSRVAGCRRCGLKHAEMTCCSPRLHRHNASEREETDDNRDRTIFAPAQKRLRKRLENVAASSKEAKNVRNLTVTKLLTELFKPFAQVLTEGLKRIARLVNQECSNRMYARAGRRLF